MAGERPGGTSSPAETARKTIRSAAPSSSSIDVLTGDPAAGDRALRIRLFDADRTDHEVALPEALSATITERQLLWIDTTGAFPGEDASAVADRFELKPDTCRRLASLPVEPSIVLHGSHFALTVAAILADGLPEQVTWLTVVAARNLVITAHAQPIAFLGDLDDRIESDTGLGAIDASVFVTVVLDSVVSSYLAAVDGIEDAVDRIDTQSLRERSERNLLAELVGLRHRIARLRRIVSSHRETFAALRRADFAVAAEGDVGEFGGVAERFERAIEAVENSRDLLLGSFDVYMTRTAQRTNDIMKTLTIVSVLLLPSGVIAGFMGMNLKAPYSTDDPRMFWVVVVLIVVVGLVTLGLLRARRWL